MTENDRRRIAIANGALLMLALGALRVEKVLSAGLDANGVDLLVGLLPDAGFVLAFECAWLLGARGTGRLGRWAWRGAYLPLHALLYAIAIADHQFFLRTGTRLDFTLLAYTVTHFGFLGDVVGSGIDGSIAPRIGLALLCFGLGALQFRAPASRTAVASAAIPTFGILLGIGTVAVAPSPGNGGAAVSPFIDVLAGHSAPSEGEWVAGGIGEIYERPVLTDRRAERRPNVILVILESTRVDVTSPYALDQRHQTPFLDDFARDAIVFDLVYTTVPHTSKALIGILCGMYPVLRMPIVEAQRAQLPLKCLPHLLRDAGYRTAFFQTALGSFEWRPTLIGNLGFERGWMQEQLDAERFEKTGYFGMDEFAMLEPAVNWIQSPEPAPFFATLLTVSTHDPYHAPGRPAPESGGDPQTRYFETIRHADRFLEALYGRLRAGGFLENTLFIVLGDHGEAFGEHGRYQHDVVPYEEGIRAPLLIQGPEWLGPPRRIGGLRHHVDLLPTLLDLLGLEWTGRLPGRNLFDAEGHRVAIASCWYDDYCMALRTGDTKFIYHYDRQPMEVFDLAADPLELHDLASEVPAALRESAMNQMLRLRYAVNAYYLKHFRLADATAGADGSDPQPYPPSLASPFAYGQSSR